MQFQRMGSKIRVIEYAGYDREKKRSIVRMIASVGVYQNQLRDDQKAGLTDEQAAEIDAYLQAAARCRNNDLIKQRALSLPTDIAAAAEYYQSHPGDLVERWEQIEAGIKKLKAIARKSQKDRK